MPYIRTLSSFRDGVRRLAIAKGETTLRDILTLSDKLRDEDLVPLGVALDDQEGAKLFHGITRWLMGTTRRESVG